MTGVTLGDPETTGPRAAGDRTVERRASELPWRILLGPATRRGVLHADRVIAVTSPDGIAGGICHFAYGDESRDCLLGLRTKCDSGGLALGNLRTAKGPGGCFWCRATQGHLFSCLPPEAIAIAERAHVPHSYEQGHTLFSEGDEAHAVYCIASGSVRLSRSNARRGEVVIGTRSAGDVVGFRAVFSDLPYGVTAVVEQPSRICAIPRTAFLELVQKSPPLALELLRRLAARSRVTEEQLVSRAHESVAARTARLLVAMSEARATGGAPSRPFRVDLAREEMALLVGTTRETLSRTLHGFARRGLVELLPTGIGVADLEALRALIPR